MSATASRQRSGRPVSLKSNRQTPTDSDQGLSAYALDRIRFHANRLSRRPGFPTRDRDDLEQELAIDPVKALRKLDPNRSSLPTFISRVVNRRCIALIRDARRYRRENVSLDDTCGDEIASDFRHRMTGYARADDVERRERAEVVQGAVAALPERLRDIAVLLMAHSQADTARVLGVSETSIDRARKQIREHFIRAGLRELI